MGANFLKRVLETEAERDKKDNEFIFNYADSRLEFLSAAIYICLSCSTILVPVILMTLVPMKQVGMTGIASCFTILSSILMSTCTNAKPHEVFQGAAR